VLLLLRMDCLIKTVKSEGYFGIYRGKLNVVFIYYIIYLLYIMNIFNLT